VGQLDYMLRVRRCNGMRCAAFSAGLKPRPSTGNRRNHPQNARMRHPENREHRCGPRPYGQTGPRWCCHLIVTYQCRYSAGTMNAVSSSAVFSFERKPSSLPAAWEPQFPYAKAWKKFDQLNELTNGGGRQAWIHWAIGTVMSGGTVFSPGMYRNGKTYALPMLVAFAVSGAIGLTKRTRWRRQLAHWPCPRCGAEWPGTKTEEEPRCAMCGLKLHQLTP